MKLYQNEISSATSRVRIALALKGLTAEALPVSILGEDAESRQAGYRSVNPQGLVPALLTDSGLLLTQSLAIVEYLDEIKPEPPLLPDTAEGRAQARSIALAIAAEIHALLPPRSACISARSSRRMPMPLLPGIVIGSAREWPRSRR